VLTAGAPLVEGAHSVADVPQSDDQPVIDIFFPILHTVLPFCISWYLDILGASSALIIGDTPQIIQYPLPTEYLAKHEHGIP